MSLPVLFYSPMPLLSGKGNAVSALRIAGLLDAAGVSARAVDAWNGEDATALVVLNSWRSAGLALDFRKRFPGRPLIAVLTGTDIFPHYPAHPDVDTALTAVDAIVAWHDASMEQIPERFRTKTHVIRKSAPDAPGPLPPAPEGECRVLLAGHLREVKDPFRAVEAACALPDSSPVTIIHAGEALSPEMAAEARAWMDRCPRYHWLGGISRERMWEELARARWTLNTSWAEGGANAVIESLCCGRPVMASRIPGNTGLLGNDWPALYPPGDTASLTNLLLRCGDGEYHAELTARAVALGRKSTAAAEATGWRTLLEQCLAEKAQHS